jgi:TusA-related sulfurtransferase
MSKEGIPILTGNKLVKPSGRTQNVDESTIEEYVVALSDRDSERLGACLHREVRMRALVPSGFQEIKGSSAVVGRLNSWFAEAESIQVIEKNVYRVADRLHVRYRFREHYSGGETAIIEQDVYCDFRDGQIVAMNLLCSGHRPEENGGVADMHHFDAGNLGCSTGLPEEFRRQIQAIPIGGFLEVTTRDPSAKEDLPSLTRLLGHRVTSIKISPDGSTTLVVQRGR